MQQKPPMSPRRSNSEVCCFVLAAPQIFQVLGLSVQVSLVNSVVTNTVNLLATFIAILIVDWSAPGCCFNAS